MNQQKPEPRLKGEGRELDVHSIFFTMQGEGPFSGHRSIFVRLAGCNLQCPGCDTGYTEGRQTRPVSELVRNVNALADLHKVGPRTLVVITGGEPLRQSIGRFAYSLWAAGFKVQIESNGVFAPDKILDSLIEDGAVTLVVSPKTSAIHPRSFALASCFKYVLDAYSVDPDDGLPIEALSHVARKGVARPRPGVPVFVNPYDEKDEELNAKHLAATLATCMKYGYIMGVQLHKLVNIE